MGRLTLWGIAGLALIATSAPAWAQGNADAAAGIVAEYCTACHVIPGYRPRFEKADVKAPDFQTMADQPEVYTTARLKAFLSKPHFPMTKFIFSASDIDNLVAFIEALRKP
jgi:cytochrome c553